jgi:hypothetical protein
MDDIHATAADDGRWMTYGELAAARHIQQWAAIRLAQRHLLRRQSGNDGLARVWVPSEMASSSPHRPTPPVSDADDIDDDTSPDVTTPFHVRALVALEDALMVANTRADEAGKCADDALALADRTLAQLADASARAERAEARADGLRDLLADAERARNTAHAECDQASQRAHKAEKTAQAAVATVDELRARDIARRAKGRLARLLVAWRGE